CNTAWPGDRTSVLDSGHRPADAARGALPAAASRRESRHQTEGAGGGQFLPSPGYCGAFLRGRMVLGDRAGRSLIMSSLVRLLSALILLLAAADASFAVRGDSPDRAQPVADTRVQIAQLPIPTLPIPTLPIP